jgi:hypothetical protein
VTATLPIVELVATCAEMHAVNQQLFERLGGWVAVTEDPGSQQLFAVACHRHAWHAQLWAARSPAIAVEREQRRSPAAAGGVGDAREAGGAEPIDRLAWYRDQLDALHAAVRRVAAGVEPLLDPATARVADQVTADLEELRRRASR